MALFRRGSKKSGEVTQDSGPDTESEDGVDAAYADETAEGTDGAAADDVVADDAAVDDAAADDVEVPDGVGPWDVTDVPELGRRIDLGALRVPGVAGMELRMEVDQKTKRVTGVGLTHDGSALQVQAFAAPRTLGIWDEIRAEIAESIAKQGGTVDDVPGPFGRELLARLPARTPDGRTGHRPARFIGHDGPRWFLRGVVSGKAAVDVEAAKTLEGVFREIVVVRGDEARPPRDLLTLTLPGAAKAAETTTPADQQSFDPLTRGPEITEIH